ncbi:MAG: tRNA lysidine(34) synthetase TilS [Clostridia bacterium]|nr:tRNA lysidine(34) synthetase TilS [Clostridia bacterium]
MLEKVIGTIEKNNLFSSNNRVIVAVSGGIDSVVLLHVLMSLRENYSLDMVVAHLNHGFRGQEAREDALFVEAISQKYGLPGVCEEISVPEYINRTKQSPQEAARTIRYNFLERVRESYDGTAIAVGQNANDQAETVLINLLRGGATSGLKGIPVRRGNIIRPLLEVSRAEIEAYAAKHRLAYRFDPSNAKPVYLRNRVRLELLPVLIENYNPAIIAGLGKTAAILAEEDKFLDQLAQAALVDCIANRDTGKMVVNLDKLDQEDLAIRRRVVRLICREIKNDGSGGDIGFDHVERVLAMLRGNTGNKAELPGGLIFQKEYEQLIVNLKRKITFKKEGESEDYAPVPLVIPGETIIPWSNIVFKAKLEDPTSQHYREQPGCSHWEIRLDLTKLKGRTLFLRKRKPGDRFQPVGMKGETKKLKDFFIDAKIPREKRDKIPLLVTGEDEIIWVVGLRAAGNYLTDSDTSQLVIITVEV